MRAASSRTLNYLSSDADEMKVFGRCLVLPLCLVATSCCESCGLSCH
jgi:hypothetical protein